LKGDEADLGGKTGKDESVGDLVQARGRKRAPRGDREGVALAGEQEEADEQAGSADLSDAELLRR
jgi:hypothetical protein